MSALERVRAVVETAVSEKVRNFLLQTPEGYTGELVLADALRSAGFERVSVWHVRCIEAWAAAVKATIGRETPRFARGEVQKLIETRLRSDLYAGCLDLLHNEARWENAHRDNGSYAPDGRGLTLGQFIRVINHKIKPISGCDCQLCAKLRSDQGLPPLKEGEVK